jgi:hypothetical protein
MEREEALPRSGVPIHIANRAEIPQYICGGELFPPLLYSLPFGKVDYWDTFTHV